MIGKLPVKKHDIQLGTVGFYELQSMLKCPFGGLTDEKILESGFLPDTQPNKQLIVGKIYHALMEKAYLVKNKHELMNFAKLITDRYQNEYRDYIVSRKLGHLRGWSEAGRALSNALLLFSKKTINRPTEKHNRKLFSTDRKFKGIPDSFCINSDTALLTEYKSSSLFDNGLIKQEYIEQVKFYAFLLKQNFQNLKTVKVSLISLSNESYEITITESEIKAHSDLLRDAYESLIGRESEQIFSFENCVSCKKKPICDSYLEKSQSCKDLREIFVLEGVLTNIEKNLKISSISLNREIINVDRDHKLLDHIICGKEYVFFNLSKVNGKYTLEENSGAYEKF